MPLSLIKRVVARWGKFRTARRISHYFKLELPERFSSVDSMAIVDVSIPYPPTCNDGPMFCHQRWFCLRRSLIRYHSDPNVLADFHARLFMHLCELFWDPYCTDFMKPKFVVHNFVVRTVANLQNMCHYINSPRLSNRTMSRARSMLSSVMA